MKMTNILLAATAAVIASAAMPAIAQDADRTDGAQIVLPAPPAGKGQIVFFRPGGFVGSAVACSVHENGQKVSSLGGGRYFIMVTDAGRHEFSVKTEATDKLPLEVEPDETQFASCKIKMGIMVGRPDIRPSTEEEFRAAKKLKLVDAEDMGPGPGALRPEEVAAALAAPTASPPTVPAPEAAVSPAAATTADAPAPEPAPAVQ